MRSWLRCTRSVIGGMSHKCLLCKIAIALFAQRPAATPPVVLIATRHRTTVGYADMARRRAMLVSGPRRIAAGRYTQFKKYFSTMNIEIGFQKRINLIFSFIIEGDNIVFSSATLQKTIYL